MHYNNQKRFILYVQKQTYIAFYNRYNIKYKMINYIE